MGLTRVDNAPVSTATWHHQPVSSGIIIPARAYYAARDRKRAPAARIETKLHRNLWFIVRRRKPTNKVSWITRKRFNFDEHSPLLRIQEALFFLLFFPGRRSIYIEGLVEITRKRYSNAKDAAL